MEEGFDGGGEVFAGAVAGDPAESSAAALVPTGGILSCDVGEIGAGQELGAGGAGVTECHISALDALIGGRAAGGGGRRGVSGIGAGGGEEVGQLGVEVDLDDEHVAAGRFDEGVAAGLVDLPKLVAGGVGDLPADGELEPSGHDELAADVGAFVRERAILFGEGAFEAGLSSGELAVDACADLLFDEVVDVGLVAFGEVLGGLLVDEGVAGEGLDAGLDGLDEVPAVIGGRHAAGAVFEVAADGLQNVFDGDLLLVDGEDGDGAVTPRIVRRGGDGGVGSGCRGGVGVALGGAIGAFDGTGETVADAADEGQKGEGQDDRRSGWHVCRGRRVADPSRSRRTGAKKVFYERNARGV